MKMWKTIRESKKTSNTNMKINMGDRIIKGKYRERRKVGR
jgi:hypothetical protein